MIVALLFAPPRMTYRRAGFAWIRVSVFQGKAKSEYGRGKSTLTIDTQQTDEDKALGHFLSVHAARLYHVFLRSCFILRLTPLVIARCQDFDHKQVL